MRPTSLAAVFIAGSWAWMSCQSFLGKNEKALGMNWSFVPFQGPLIPLAHGICSGIDGKLLVFGGIEEGGGFFNQKLIIYDDRSQQWQLSHAEGGPSARNFAAHAAFEESLFIFGGQTAGETATSDGFAYEISSGTWEKLLDAEGLVPRNKASLTKVGHQLVLFGGQGPSEVTNWARYDVQKGQWTVHNSKPAMESRLAHLALPLGDSHLWVWGGFVGSERRGNGFILDIFSQDLQVLPPTPALSARSNAQAFQIDGEIYVWGGSTVDGNSNSGASFKINEQIWQALPPIPDERFNKLMGAVAAPWRQEGFLVFGGRFGTDAFNDQLWLYEIDRRKWKEIKANPSPQGRLGHCVVPLSAERLAVFGGLGLDKTSEFKHFDGVWILNETRPSIEPPLP